MADLLIQGMHLPKLGYVTTITIYHDGTVADKMGNVETVKAVELPPHGRLISAEDFIDSFQDIINDCRRQLSEKGEDITVLNNFHDSIIELMGYMPTVLEASK